MVLPPQAQADYYNEINRQTLDHIQNVLATRPHYTILRTQPNFSSISNQSLGERDFLKGGVRVWKKPVVMAMKGSDNSSSDDETDVMGAGRIDSILKKVSRSAKKQVKGLAVKGLAVGKDVAIKALKKGKEKINPILEKAATDVKQKVSDIAREHLNDLVGKLPAENQQQEEEQGGKRKKRGRPSKLSTETGGKGNFFKKLGKAIKKGATQALDVVKDVGSQAANQAVGQLKQVGQQALQQGVDQLKNNAGQMLTEAAESGAGRKKGRSPYNILVKKIMAEKKMKMIDAVKYIKAKGLYKK